MLPAALRAAVASISILAAWGCQPAVRTAPATPPSEMAVAYVVEVKDTAARIFHVTATFSNVRQSRLDLALPIWTPGWYTLEYYAKNVRRFSVSNGKGAHLDAPLTDAQTWSVDTRGHSTVVAEFDYRATRLSHNQAKITSRYAFFTGTQLFLEPVGHRGARSTVRFTKPYGWRIASALTETADASLFSASSYDELVDAPTWLGAFKSHDFRVDGKLHRIVVDSMHAFPMDSVQRYADRLTTMIRSAAGVFGGLPYDKYLFMMLPDTSEGASGALEHGNSTVSCCGGRGYLAGPGRYVAHEFFHLWNVKRIRPAELWPYDYSRPIATPSLWVSEGITDYYGILIAYRAGLTREPIPGLVAWAGEAAGIETAERRHVSLSDASNATWRDYLNEPVDYYAGGAVMGLLLDLSILHDTRGEKRLDDVMRALYRNYYMHERGFTATDLVREVSAVAGQDYGDFFRRYVTGVEIPPYDTILGYAGIRRMGPTTGFIDGFGADGPEGLRLETIVPSGVGALAGLRKGDLVILVNDVPIDRVLRTPNGCCFVIEPGGERIVMTVLRDGARLQLPVTLRSARAVMTVLDPNATPEQMVVRRAWFATP